MAMATPGPVKRLRTLATYASKPGGGAAGLWAVAREGTSEIASSAARPRSGRVGVIMAENVSAAGPDRKLTISERILRGARITSSAPGMPPVPQGSDASLRVTSLVRAAAGDIATRAEALMLEQTVELPRAAAARDPWVAAHILGRVEWISPAGDGTHRVTIAQPLVTTAGDPAQLL